MKSFSPPPPPPDPLSTLTHTSADAAAVERSTTTLPVWKRGPWLYLCVHLMWITKCCFNLSHHLARQFSPLYYNIEEAESKSPRVETTNWEIAHAEGKMWDKTSSLWLPYTLRDSLRGTLPDCPKVGQHIRSVGCRYSVPPTDSSMKPIWFQHCM